MTDQLAKSRDRGPDTGNTATLSGSVSIDCLRRITYLWLLTEVGAADDLMKKSQVQFQTIPSTPPVIEGNQTTPEKVPLCKMLYFEPRLSASALISLNTCHHVGMGGDAFQETSIVHGWQKGPGNARTLLNSVFNVAQFWNGRAPDLRDQTKEPVQAALEMNNVPDQAIETLTSIPEYAALFKRAVPGEREPVIFDNMSGAIDVFEATLTTPDAGLTSV